jgi:hypothetical protein
MTYDEIDNLLEAILFDNTTLVRRALQEMENEGTLDTETRISLTESLVE